MEIYSSILFRDLKLEHIVISSEGHVRLVDYGLARLLKTSDEVCLSICGTDRYMAPEVNFSQKKTSNHNILVHIKNRFVLSSTVYQKMATVIL